ncbi:MAG TPA: response regulator transcription factor [Steroidobacteraceae bacterium]
MIGHTLACSSIRTSTQGDHSPHPMKDLNGGIRVLVVDGQPLMREGIAAVLSGKPDLTIVGEASDGQEAIEKFRALRPDVTVMDLQMPRLSGIDAIHAIRHETPNARVVMLTTTTGDFWARRALKAGVASYMLKGQVRTELADIIRSVHQGMRRIEPAIALQMAECTDYQMPTSREVEVLDLIAAGNSNKLIARALLICEETAKSHVKNIIAKLGARDRTHAVTLGLRRGFIQL